MNSKIRVLIADDQVISREGVQRLLEREPDMEVAGVVTTAPEVLIQVSEKEPDVVLLDMKWHRDDYAMDHVIARLLDEYPGICTVVLTGHDDLMQRAKALGVKWVLTKDVNKDDLIHFIRGAYTSDRLVNQEKTDKAHTTPRQQPSIGIITALPKEYVAVKTVFENQKEHTVPGRGAGRRYLLGEMAAANSGRHILILSLADMGNNIAANRATLLLEHFPTVKSIIMVGIAGGVPHISRPDEHVRLGDIVVSDRQGVIQYDFDKETITEVIHRHPPRPPSATLLEGVRLLEAAEIEGNRPWLKFVDQITAQLDIARPPEESDILADPNNPEATIAHPEDPKRLSGQPRAFTGPIASANKLLKNPIKRDELRQQFGIKAIEMEGSGIADASWNHEVGYLVVRGICDYCDSNKGDEWQAYAAAVAAAYTRALLESIPA